MSKLIVIWLILIAAHGAPPHQSVSYWNVPYYTQVDCEKARAELDGNEGFRAENGLKPSEHLKCVSEKLGLVPRD